MGDVLQALLYDLLSTLVVLPAVTAGILYVANSLPAKRIWDVRRPLWRIGASFRTPAVVIATSGVHGNQGYERPMTGVGQVRAIATISPSIHRAFGSHIGGDHLSMSRGLNLARSTMHGDLVCIGGPKTNEVTRELLSRLEGFLPAGTTLATTDVGSGGQTDQIVWDGITQEPGDAVVYGLIIRCRNPLGHGDGVLTLLAGTGTYGTEAAAEALVTDRSLRGPWIRSLGGRRRAYVALVRASCTKDAHGVDLGPARVHALHELTWATVAP